MQAPKFDEFKTKLEGGKYKDRDAANAALHTYSRRNGWNSSTTSAAERLIDAKFPVSEVEPTEPTEGEAEVTKQPQVTLSFENLRACELDAMHAAMSAAKGLQGVLTTEQVRDLVIFFWQRRELNGYRHMLENFFEQAVRVDPNPWLFVSPSFFQFASVLVDVAFKTHHPLEDIAAVVDNVPQVAGQRRGDLDQMKAFMDLAELCERCRYVRNAGGLIVLYAPHEQVCKYLRDKPRHDDVHLFTHRLMGGYMGMELHPETIYEFVDVVRPDWTYVDELARVFIARHDLRGAFGLAQYLTGHDVVRLCAYLESIVLKHGSEYAITEFGKAFPSTANRAALVERLGAFGEQRVAAMNNAMDIAAGRTVNESEDEDFAEIWPDPKEEEPSGPNILEQLFSRMRAQQ